MLSSGSEVVRRLPVFVSDLFYRRALEVLHLLLWCLWVALQVLLESDHSIHLFFNHTLQCPLFGPQTEIFVAAFSRFSFLFTGWLSRSFLERPLCVSKACFQIPQIAILPSPVEGPLHFATWRCAACLPLCLATLSAAVQYCNQVAFDLIITVFICTTAIIKVVIRNTSPEV